MGERPPDCIHRDISDEAYRVDMTSGRETPIQVYLCNWPEANPAFFVDAPRWLQKQVYPGLAVVPERDCVNCPARRALTTKGDRL